MSSRQQYCRYVYSIGLKQNARKGESPFHIPVSDNKQTTGNKALFRHSLLFGLERKAMGKSIIRPIFGAHAKLRLLQLKLSTFQLISFEGSERPAKKIFWLFSFSNTNQVKRLFRVFRPWLHGFALNNIRSVTNTFLVTMFSF